MDATTGAAWAEVVEALAVGALVVEGEVVLRANPAARALLGDDVVATALPARLTSNCRDAAARYLRSAAALPGNDTAHRAGLLRADGALLHLDLTARPLGPQRPGRPPLLAVTVVDVTAAVLREEQLRHSGLRDAATGVLSGAAFREIVLDRWRDGTGGSLLLVAVDGLRHVADAYGDSACDDVLRTLAGRFGRHVDPVGTTGRLRAEQFGVLLPQVPADQAEQFAERLRLEARRPVLVSRGEVGVTVSIGVVGFPDPDPRAGAEAGVEPLLRRADLALFLAQNDGGDQVAGYRGEMEGLGEKLKTLSAQVLDLRRARNLAEEAARTDALTGLPNRAALDDRLRVLPTQAARAGVPLSVAFVDVDHFGAFNHAHGDAAGDRALRQVAAALRSGVRTQDSAFRKGGEEFVCLLYGAGGEEARAVAERLRAAVAALGVTHDAAPSGRLSVTVGVATWWDGCGRSLADVVDAAGTAAFRGKALGRDRVTVDGDDPAGTTA